MVEPAHEISAPSRPDMRAAALAAAAWAGALAGLAMPRWSWLACASAIGVLAALRVVLTRRSLGLTLAACLLVCVAVAGLAVLRADAHRWGTVGRLAADRASVRVELTIRSDPVTRSGRFGDFVVVEATTRMVSARGVLTRTSAPVLLLGDSSWAGVELGSRVRTLGRLGPPRGADVAAVLRAGRPQLSRAPPRVLRGAQALRASIRAAMGGSSEAARTLVPALVVGDDTAISPDVVEDFQTAGLTHLTAVSGTNVTIVVGSLLIVARWAGVRARGLVVVGLVGAAGFVLLARPDPSVLRAATMGAVALVGMGSGGRSAGSRALGVAVLVLLLADPWLAISPGFALSALATAGILLVAPWFRDQLRAWVPRWAAEAVSVPLAAQLACTPLVAGLSGQVSLVAVLANLLVAPLVAPATVLGLLGGVVGLVLPSAGLVCGRLAGWCADWVVAVATRAAALPVAAVSWSTGRVGLAGLTILCVLGAVLIGRLLRGRVRSLLAVALLVAVMLRPLPEPGWPPRDWVMVACDVGQGDGLVLSAGDDRAVVVDAGPDAALIDRCLDRLGVERVPVLVLSHYHADHVAGLRGVLSGREVGQVQATGTEDPTYGAAEVRATLREAGVPLRVPAYGEVRRLGQLTWQVVGPATAPLPGAGEGDAANDASLVLLVEVRGVRILLTGDIEPPAQRALHSAVEHLRVDVLKVPHHGSRFQDLTWLTALGARAVIVSAGADNDYGHPSPDTLEILERTGAVVRRTDLQGDVAVIAHDGEIRLATR